MKKIESGIFHVWNSLRSAETNRDVDRILYAGGRQTDTQGTVVHDDECNRFVIDQFGVIVLDINADQLRALCPMTKDNRRPRSAIIFPSVSGQVLEEVRKMTLQL